MTDSLPYHNFVWSEVGLTSTNPLSLHPHPQDATHPLGHDPYAAYQHNHQRFGSVTPPPPLSNAVSDEEDGGTESESGGNGAGGGVPINTGVGIGGMYGWDPMGHMYGVPAKFSSPAMGYDYQSGMAVFAPMGGHHGQGHYTAESTYVPYFNGGGPVGADLVHRRLRGTYVPSSSVPYNVPISTTSSTTSSSTTPQSQYKCTYPTCTRPFATLAALKSHLRSHASSSNRHTTSASPPPRSVASSNATASPPPQQHHDPASTSFLPDNSNRIHACPSCPSTFRRTHDLKRHYRSIHTVEKPFVCSVCRSGFARRDALKRHIGRVGSMCYGAGMSVGSGQGQA